MANEKIDYLLINSTNEFLAEYSDLSENARYLLTNFSGSTGDALLSQKDLFLFVDGRYHEQADLEASEDTTVVKMKLHQSFSHCLEKKISPKKTLAIVAKKNSQGRYEILSELLKGKNVSIKLLETDPTMEFSETPKEKIKSKIEQIDIKIAGVSADKKLALVASNIKQNEAILTTSSEEISYLCNLRDFSANFSCQIKAKCLIMKDSALLFTDTPIKEFSKKFKNVPLKDFASTVRKLENIDIFLVDKTSITAYDYGLLVDKIGFLKDNRLKEMKSVKNESEIAHYKDCFERTDKALSAIREFILKSEKLSEHDIAKELEEEFHKNGAKSLSFNSIVAKDKNAALAHYNKNSPEEILKEGSLILIDCGGYFEGGYATDITRVFVKGKPSKMQKTVYTIVLKGFLAAFNKKITPKTSGYDLDKAARKVIDPLAPKGFAFSHALGHGIGINVHEAPPNLGHSPIAKNPLKPNMCFTIEPGLYKKGFGGVRLENSCYLAQEGDKLSIKSFSKMCFEEKLIDFELLTAREKKWLNFFDVK